MTKGQSQRDRPDKSSGTAPDFVPRRASLAEIKDIVAKIVARIQPQQVILFGSYAEGNPSADSDVDLLVIVPFEGSPLRKALGGRPRT